MKRFTYEKGIIRDEWSDYNYEYDNIQDWKQLCGLLNQLHEILEKTIEGNNQEIDELNDFKDNVFKVIDKFIEAYKDDISSYGSCYGMYLADKLELLKQELKS